MAGRFCVVEPIDPDRHARDLFAANAAAPDDRKWTYLPYGPFDDIGSYRRWLERECLGDDPLYFAIVVGGSAVGVASYLRIDPAFGVIEIGNINASPALQATTASTEAMYLMMRRVFDELGYRRYEWKCDALNEPSRRAAARLGFTYEGTFRRHLLYKGRSRDTAWFSIVDEEWPARRAAFEAWLSDANFDEYGNQRRSLSSFMA